MLCLDRQVDAQFGAKDLESPFIESYRFRLLTDRRVTDHQTAIEGFNQIVNFQTTLIITDGLLVTIESLEFFPTGDESLYELGMEPFTHGDRP